MERLLCASCRHCWAAERYPKTDIRRGAKFKTYATLRPSHTSRVTVARFAPQESITGTSTNTPTTVESAAPDWKPNRAIAVATASSKKLLAPMSADGPATHQATPSRRFKPISQPRVEVDPESRSAPASRAITAGWCMICSPWRPNSSTSVSSSAERDSGPRARKVRPSAAMPPEANKVRRQSCATITGTTM